MVATSKLFSKDVFIDLKKKIPESNQKHRHLRSCSAISEDTVPYSVNLSISVGKYKKVSNSQLFTAQYRHIYDDENVMSSSV